MRLINRYRICLDIINTPGDTIGAGSLPTFPNHMKETLVSEGFLLLNLLLSILCFEYCCLLFCTLFFVVMALPDLFVKNNINGTNLPAPNAHCKNKCF